MKRIVGWAGLAWGVACSPDQSEPEVPEVYTFDSRFTDGSSVDYSGQVFRQLLINELAGYAEDLTERIDTGYFPQAGEVEAALDFYFSFDSSTAGTLPHTFVADPAPLQTTYDEVAANKNLRDKVAGNDPEGQHRDWSVDFVGWSPGMTPESLYRTWFAEIDAAAVARANGDVPLGPTGEPIRSVAVSADGVDRSELLQKFSYGAITFSQAADDYLDDDGLLAANDGPSEEGVPYSALEHGWDEGFGYLGMARDALLWGDDLLGGAGYADSYAPDGSIDLLSEVSWGIARYAAQRDLAAVVSTDLTRDVFEPFLAGRALISANESLDDVALEELRAHRDRALAAWEAILAASAIHYVNETLADMSQFGTDSYDFERHAAHWSELKGLLLAFQFNPHSAVDATTFETLHAAVGLAPVLPTAEPAVVEAYRASLLELRTTLGGTFGFDPANLGDDDGANGW